MTEVWHFFLLVLYIFMLFAWFYLLWMVITDLFADKSMGGWAKALWIVVLIFFPLLGTLVYVIARGKGMSERREKAAQEAQHHVNEYIRKEAMAGSATELLSAKQLLDSGTITPEEFEKIKKQVVGS